MENNNMPKVKKHWITAAAIVGVVLVAALAVALSFMADMKKDYETQLDNMYKKSFYEATDALKDVELKLSKVSVSEGAANQKALLSELWMNTEIAQNNLAQLSAKDGNMEKVIKFLNQMGDYCLCLAKKIDDTPLSEAEKEKLDSLHIIVKKLQESLTTVNDSIANNATLVGKLDEGIQLLGDCYEHFNNDSNIEYPEMIYDGPFSDALAIRDAKYLNTLPEVTQQESEAKLRLIIKGIKQLEYLGKLDGNIPSFRYSVTTESGTGQAQISQNGGLLVLYNAEQETDGEAMQSEQLEAMGKQLLEDMGYDNLKLVWVTPTQSAVYLNYVYYNYDTVFYPDFVKLKLAADTGEMLGLDATGYAYNHIEREAPQPDTTIQQARQAISTKLTIEDERICVIPTKWNTEIDAYEFKCTKGEDTFYIYIDASTLEEINILKVVDNKTA